MARELQIEVTAETRQAEQALARVDHAEQKLADSTEDVNRVVQEQMALLEKEVAATRKAREATEQATRSQDDLSEAKRRAKDRSRELEQQSNTLTDAILKYAGPAVIIAAFKRTIDFADSIQTLSQRTGFTTTGIQQIGAVAQRTGSSFEQVAASVQQLDNRLASGNKTAVTMVERLGQSVEGLLALSPEDRFRDIAVAIAGIRDPAERTEAAMALFGRTGGNLIPLMEEIATGADKQAPAFSNAWIDAIAQVNDAFQEAIAWGDHLVKAFIVWPAIIARQSQAWGEAMYQTLGLIAGPELPGVASPARNLPNASVPGDPFGPGGVGGQSLAFIEKSLALPPGTLSRGRENRGGARVIPFPGPGLVGLPHGLVLPGQGVLRADDLFVPFPSAAPPVAPLGAAFQGFQGVGFASSVTQQPSGATPSGGGGFLSGLKNLFGFGGGGTAGTGGGFWSQAGGNLLSTGAGMLTSVLGRFDTTGGTKGGAIGSSIGGIAGSMFGPLGSIAGSWLGGKVGNLFGAGEHGKVNDMRDEFFAQFGKTAAEQVDNLNKKAHDAGLTLDRLYSAKKVKDFEAAVDELTDAFAQQEADQARLATLVDKYGFTVDELGQKFKQQQMNKTWQDVGEDIRVALNAGIDFATIAARMGDELGSLVQTSKEMGTTVPAELRPVIQRMIEMGTLVDRNGQKFTDLSQVPFAESMTQGFDRVVAAIDRMVAALGRAEQGANDLGSAVNNIPAPDYGGGDSGNDPDIGFDAGGVVGRDFRRRSSRDVIPAWLRPGELVITPEQQQAGRGRIALSIGNLTVGRFDSRRDAVEETGEQIIRYLERRGVRLAS